MLSFDYRGKSVLVTGAGRGLGFAMARAFLEAGARVFVNDRNAELVRAAIARLPPCDRLVPAPADLSTPDGAANAVAPALAAGELHVLINNAAVNVEKSIEETSDEHWDQHLAVVLGAPFFTAKAALPLLRVSRGCIINIASELGLHAIPNNIAYVSAKHGVLALTRALAIELAPSHIRVNALCPGTMDTELMQDCAQASGDAEDYYRRFRQYHPLGRIATPDEIAGFVLCLASPAAAFMTGSVLAIDGGSSAGRM
jgi:NAD(P)-dependent dehydrogenase (short-subunit alcohol dehydrogenase family)